MKNDETASTLLHAGIPQLDQLVGEGAMEMCDELSDERVTAFVRRGKAISGVFRAALGLIEEAEKRASA